MPARLACPQCAAPWPESPAELAALTACWCSVFAVSQADGGVFVKVSKRGFAEALAKVHAAADADQQ